VIERERKFLVRSLPPDLGPAVEIRQGYLAVDGEVEVRVRDAGGAHVLTVKGGHGRDRTEVETPLEPRQFDALWPLTGGRRLEKARHRVPLDDDLTAEVDVYRGRHEGLRVVEVEMPTDRDPDDFTPPPWFGPEITGDPRFANATLAAASGPPPTET
jgi:adenylate cyclase